MTARITQRLFTTLCGSLLLAACATTPNPQANPTVVTGDVSYDEITTTYPFFTAQPKSFPEQAVQQLKASQEPTELVVYFAVWCPDSIREVPELMQLLDTVNNPNISYQLIALDYKKQEPQGRAKANNILYTPTMVVFQNEREIGRIIEKPEQDLASDLAGIISKGQE